MTEKLVIGLTDRERVLHSANAKKMGEAMLLVSECLLDPERDVETLIGLVVIGLQAGNIDQMLQAVKQATEAAIMPDDVSGAEEENK